MTFVGKLLVVANLVLSCIFMGFAFMVYTTRVELRKEEQKLKSEVAGLKTAKADLVAKNDALDAQIADEVQKFERREKENAETKENLDRAIASLQQEIQEAQEESAKAIAEMGRATTEQVQRRTQVATLREDRNGLIRAKQDLVMQKTALLDELTQVKNDLDLGNQRNQQLVDKLRKLQAYAVRVTGKAPTPIELDSGNAVPPPPNVDGVVTKVDRTGRFIELSLGEDDGLRKGQTLEVWRTSPQPKYIGKIKVYTTQHTTAVAQPVSTVGPVQPKDRFGPRVLADRTAN